MTLLGAMSSSARTKKNFVGNDAAPPIILRPRARLTQLQEAYC